MLFIDFKMFAMQKSEIEDWLLNVNNNELSLSVECYADNNK